MKIGRGSLPKREPRLTYPRMPPKKTPKNPQAVEIGERIRALRQDAGMSRKELAALLKTREGKPQGVGKIAQWEQGVSVPAPDRRQELAEALGVEVSAVFGEAQDVETISRLDVIERKVEALIAIQGLGDLVEAKLQEYKRQDRRRAENHRKSLMQVAEQAPALVTKSTRPSRRRRNGN